VLATREPVPRLQADGIFADHSAYEDITIGSPHEGQGPNQLCNGKGAGKRCYDFTDEFRDSFNSWHQWSTDYTQDVLAKSTGGAVFQVPGNSTSF